MMAVANITIEVVFVPERAALTKQAVRLPRVNPLFRLPRCVLRVFGIQQNMNMVGHDDPAAQFEGARLLPPPQGRKQALPVSVQWGNRCNQGSGRTSQIFLGGPDADTIRVSEMNQENVETPATG